MRIRRLIRRAGVFLCAALAAALVLYALAIRIPGYYKPLRLSAARRDDGMHRFVNHISRFCSQAGAGKPFTWTLTAEQANEYLASMDAIAALSGRPLHPSARLAQAGFEDPAVAMRDGVLTVAVRSRRHNKILSLDLRFEFNEAGELTARIAGARIGSLPVPRRLLDERIRRVRGELSRRLAAIPAQAGARVGPMRLDELTGMLRQLMAMTDGKGVRPEIVSPLGGHRVLIREVRISDGRLTLECVSADRPRPTDATDRRTRGRAQTAP